MSVYNGEEYLREAVESILRQSFTDFEFIILEDGSTDSTAAILCGHSDPRIVRLQNPQRMGLAASLNRGLATASGEFVARQDADDISLPDRLATQVAFLETQPAVVLLGTATEWVNESGKPLGQIVRHPCSDAAIRWRMLLHNSFCHSSVMVRRSVLDKSQLWYNAERQYAQDYDLWSRVLADGQGANIPLPLVQLRSHRDQITRVAWQAQQAVADQIARANFARAGLASHFSKEEITSMRRIGYQGTSVGGEALLTQVRSLLRLLRHTGSEDRAAEPELKIVQKQKSRQLRLDLTHPPRDLAMFRAQLLMVRADPIGVMADIAGLLPRRAQSSSVRMRRMNST